MGLNDTTVMGNDVRDTCKGMSLKFFPHFSYSRNTHVCFLSVVCHVIKNSYVCRPHKYFRYYWVKYRLFHKSRYGYFSGNTKAMGFSLSSTGLRIRVC